MESSKTGKHKHLKMLYCILSRYDHLIPDHDHQMMYCSAVTILEFSNDIRYHFWFSGEQVP